MTTTRRAFCATIVQAATGVAAAGCQSLLGGQDVASGRLAARPGVPTGSVNPGLTTIGTAAARDGLLYVPASYDPSRPAPLLLALHGAGGTAAGPIQFLGPAADTYGLLLVAVDSLGSTWDTSGNSDVRVMDRALRYAFDRCAVDAERVFLEGFSDGASYTLGLGLTNGDLFSRLIAFSPGYRPFFDPHGRPAIFVSHGRQDTVLSFEETSQHIVPSLEADGYAVDFRAYDGGHSVPPDIGQDAFAWLMGPVVPGRG